VEQVLGWALEGEWGHDNEERLALLDPSFGLLRAWFSSF
jgi:hypothetical protein